MLEIGNFDVRLGLTTNLYIPDRKVFHQHQSRSMLSTQIADAASLSSDREWPSLDKLLVPMTAEVKNCNPSTDFVHTLRLIK
jgi:hypothetical protein